MTDVGILDAEAWSDALDDRLDRLAGAIDTGAIDRPVVGEVGRVRRVDAGIAEVDGLPGVRSEELVSLGDGVLALALDLGRDRLGVVLLDPPGELKAGDPVRRGERVLSVPVGAGLVGRVVDPTGRPLDGAGRVDADAHWPIERPAPPIMDRSPVEEPLQTGITAIDTLVPIGRGQRELVLGDRQTGKTAIGVDTIINQRGTDVICIYAAIGQRSAAIAKTIDDLRAHDSLAHTIVVASSSDDPPGRQFIAPYAATSMAEYLMEEAGRDVFVVYDDLTRHARAHRELSLLLRRPPGREAYPGDVFYLHSRLLERPTNLRDGGSITALPIIETKAQNISDYIPTNLISITDGQLYLSPRLLRQGILPAIDVGRSVSRVGGRAQLPAYRAVAGDLRLSYSQFEELERFSKYGARLEPEREAALARGRRVRQVLRQGRYEPLTVAEQLATLVAVTGGALDGIEVDAVADRSKEIAARMVDAEPELFDGLEAGDDLTDDDIDHLLGVAHDLVGGGER